MRVEEIKPEPRIEPVVESKPVAEAVSKQPEPEETEEMDSETFCPECRTIVSSKAENCYACGADLKNPRPVEQKVESKEKVEAKPEQEAKAETSAPSDSEEHRDSAEDVVRGMLFSSVWQVIRKMPLVKIAIYIQIRLIRLWWNFRVRWVYE
jgi:hypothetical protein